MGGVTENMREIVGMEADWLGGSRWMTPITKEAHPYFPHVLFIDEDVRLAKKMARIANRNRISLVTCRSAGDLNALKRHEPFDVAILDFNSGDFARKQVGRFLGYHVPVLIVGASPSSNELEKDFPKAIHKVIDKNAGARVILEEALALVGARHLLEEKEPTGARVTEKIPHAFWLVAATLIALLSLWMMTRVRSPQDVKAPAVSPRRVQPLAHKGSAPTDVAPITSSPDRGLGLRPHLPRRSNPIPKTPKNIYRWDQAPVIPQMQSG